MRRKSIIIVLIIFILFSGNVETEAVTRLERFLIENPKLFRLIALGVCLLMGLIFVGYQYALTRLEIQRIVDSMSQDKRKKKEKEREAAERLKQYRKIPKGHIEELKIPKATIIALGSEQKEYPLTAKMEITIGRGLDNVVIVNRPSTSREHARIRPEKEGYVIYDLLSKAGTYVNSKRIMSQVLRDGDIIGIGKENFLFKY